MFVYILKYFKLYILKCQILDQNLFKILLTLFFNYKTFTMSVNVES